MNCNFLSLIFIFQQKLYLAFCKAESEPHRAGYRGSSPFMIKVSISFYQGKAYLKFLYICAAKKTKKCRKVYFLF